MSQPWQSLTDFAGFRGKRDTKVLGRLAVPPEESPAAPAAASAADRVRERLAALKSKQPVAAQPATRTPGIAQRPAQAAPPQAPAKAEAAEASASEVLLFSCRGSGCRHSWISGRSSTSSEQICKQCGNSVVGKLTRGGVLCEPIEQEAASAESGEILGIRIDQPLGPGLATFELEESLKDFVKAELRFFSRFFDEDGVADYVAHRRGQGAKDDRDVKQDVVLVDHFANLVAALCHAEFDGTMRGGEADAKLQALLKGQISFRFLSADRNQGKGATLRAAVDFAISLDVEDRIADEADRRLQKLRRVMTEMDRKLQERPPEAFLPHPRRLLARLISGFDWKRALRNEQGRDGHDRIRCMTCRFIKEDCSTNVARSQDVRQALRSLPGFVYRAELVITRTARTAESWQDRISPLLDAVCNTKGGECFIEASVAEKDQLRLRLYSHPDWLAGAVDRLCTYASSGESQSATSLASLVGLGRAGKGLHVVEQKSYEVISDVWSFLDYFAGQNSQAQRVKWLVSAPVSLEAGIISDGSLQAARGLFRSHCALEDMSAFLDFLRDFRNGGGGQAIPEPRTAQPKKKEKVKRRVSVSRTRSRCRSRSRGPRARRSPSYGPVSSEKAKR